MKLIRSKYIYIISALLALSSCSTDETYLPDGGISGESAVTRISAGIPDTKTITDDAFNTRWSPEDCIGVFSPESYCGWYISA